MERHRMDKSGVPGVTFRSIGCRTNQEEMAALAAVLVEEGYRLVEHTAEAQIIIVNTCSVTAATESKTRRYLRSLAANAPHARICATGCLAQQDPSALSGIKGITWVVGNTFKKDIGNILRTFSGGVHAGHFEAEKALHLDMSDAVVPPPGAPGWHRTRFSVKIQEGCNFHCAYCIVPQLRGPSRSARTTAVVDVCREAILAGYKELVLTGTHIGQFDDRAHGGLPELLDRLAAIEGDYRIRLSSLDPRDCTDGLLSRIGAVDKICDHVHVSLQSLSPEVLTAMRRPVETTIACLDRLIGFRNSHPLAGIGADIITGFPGETDAHFEETRVACDKIGLSYAHVFRYSPRPGTAAVSIKPVVPEVVKKQRSLVLRNMIQRSRRQFLKKVEPIAQRIIVESILPVRGLTSNYIHVELPGEDAVCNTWMDVTIRSTMQPGRTCPAQPVLRKVA